MTLILRDAPECVPSLVPKPGDVPFVGVFTRLAYRVHGNRFTLGGSYQQNAPGTPLYHSYLIDVVVPQGVMMVITWAGFDQIFTSTYHMWLDGTPYPGIWDIGAYTYAGYDEVNPPPAGVYTGKAYAMCRTDAALSGINGIMDMSGDPLVVRSGVNIRLRGLTNAATQYVAAWIRGYYCPNNDLGKDAHV